MASYKRPPSRSEVRQMRREKKRIIFFSALVILTALGALVGLLYVLNRSAR